MLYRLAGPTCEGTEQSRGTISRSHAAFCTTWTSQTSIWWSCTLVRSSIFLLCQYQAHIHFFHSGFKFLLYDVSLLMQSRCCSYRPVLRNIESSLIKMKQDGSFVVRWWQNDYGTLVVIMKPLFKDMNLQCWRNFCAILKISSEWNEAKMV